MRQEYIWALITLVIAIALAYILLTLTKDVQSEAQVQCVDEKLREDMRELALQAMDDSFKEQTAHLFTVWQKDVKDQPVRAQAGMQANVRAYVRARSMVLNWNPPSC
jgi:hypothetical protein